MRITLGAVTATAGASPSATSAIGVVPFNANDIQNYYGNSGRHSHYYCCSSYNSVQMRMAFDSITAVTVTPTTTPSTIDMVP